MNADDARTIVADALARVAPEADLAAVPGDAELAYELDLDSIDFLNLVTAVAEAIGREIPERDLPALATLDGFLAYVAAG